MSDSEQPSSEQELIDSVIEQALAPYKAVLPPEMLAEMRASLEDRLTEHPDAKTLVRRALEDPVVDNSGDVVKADGPIEGADEDAPHIEEGTG